MNFSSERPNYFCLFIISFLHPTHPISPTPLFHTTVDSGDLRSTEGEISFVSTARPHPFILEKPCSTCTQTQLRVVPHS